MKKLFLLVSLAFIASTSFAQWQWGITFDNSTFLNRIYRDTVSNPNCIWQIGRPTKTVFTAAHSAPKAIVTDTLHAAPANDTSIFYLKHVRTQTMSWHFFALHFYFQLNGDSTDIGKVEISPDTGHTWINLMTQDTTYNVIWQSPKPTLNGSTSGWQYFNISMQQWASYPAFGGGPYPVLVTADTILFRFTYISDSSSAPHDGWMIDDISLEDWFEGIPEIQNNKAITLSPNPFNTQTTITVNGTFQNPTLYLYNLMGQEVNTISIGTKKQITIPRNQLPSGLYFYKLIEENNNILGVGKVVVE